MKQKLKSLRIRLLLPVIFVSLFVVIILNIVFTRSYNKMVLEKQQEANTLSFDAISRSVTPLITTSLSEVRSMMSDNRVEDYIRSQYSSPEELIHARIDCADYLKAEIARHGGIYGVLFMREDGSLFGALPEGTLFLDDPQENPIPEAMKTQILKGPRTETIWTGPVSGSVLYGFENENTPGSIMIAAWQNMDVDYGVCYGMMLVDESVFEDLFADMQDENSIWHVFTADQTEFYHTGSSECADPERLLEESNSGSIFESESGIRVCAFSRTMESPDWILVHEASMEDYEQVISDARRTVALFGAIILLIALGIYEVWLYKFMQQFNSLKQGIIRMGEGELVPTASASYTIGEFETMQGEIDRTCIALNNQMDTIREMERERIEQENMLKERDRVLQELSTARQIQRSVLPHIFPAFPHREEIDLYASMDPARDIGGDFYDFFFMDRYHLCLVIADVSGKGIPAALFMMFAKRIIEDSAVVDRSAGGILEKTNEMLCDNNQAEMFVTVWLGILDVSTGRMTAANAGHEYPLIARKGSGFELYKDKHGFVLGGMEGVKYREYELQLNPGDKIFVYTDGIPEATSENEEMFGTKRMISALNACADESPGVILKEMRKAVDAFVGEAEQFDDLTMMCLEYKGRA